MNELSSKVVIQHGKTRFAGMSEGTVTIIIDRLVIKNLTQTFLDVPLSEIKKVNFQFTLFYIYTKKNGVKVVDFRTKDKTDESASVEVQQWVDIVNSLGLKVRDSRRLFVYIAGTLVVLAIIRVFVSLLS